MTLYELLFVLVVAFLAGFAAGVLANKPQPRAIVVSVHDKNGVLLQSQYLQEGRGRFCSEIGAVTVDEVTR